MEAYRRRGPILPDAYEKFPAQEFDAWIGGLKDKIRSGLNAPLPEITPRRKSFLDRYDEREARSASRVASDSSFVATRDKGKGRMEGERPIKPARASSPIVISDDDESRRNTVPPSSDEVATSEDEVEEVLERRSPSPVVPSREALTAHFVAGEEEEDGEEVWEEGSDSRGSYVSDEGHFAVHQQVGNDKSSPIFIEDYSEEEEHSPAPRSSPPLGAQVSSSPQKDEESDSDLEITGYNPPSEPQYYEEEEYSEEEGSEEYSEEEEGEIQHPQLHTGYNPGLGEDQYYADHQYHPHDHYSGAEEEGVEYEYSDDEGAEGVEVQDHQDPVWHDGYHADSEGAWEGEEFEGYEGDERKNVGRDSDSVESPTEEPKVVTMVSRQGEVYEIVETDSGASSSSEEEKDGDISPRNEIKERMGVAEIVRQRRHLSPAEVSVASLEEESYQSTPQVERIEQAPATIPHIPGMFAPGPSFIAPESPEMRQIPFEPMAIPFLGPSNHMEMDIPPTETDFSLLASQSSTPPGLESVPGVDFPLGSNVGLIPHPQLSTPLSEIRSPSPLQTAANADTDLDYRMAYPAVPLITVNSPPQENEFVVVASPQALGPIEWQSQGSDLFTESPLLGRDFGVIDPALMAESSDFEIGATHPVISYPEVPAMMSPQISSVTGEVERDHEREGEEDELEQPAVQTRLSASPRPASEHSAATQSIPTPSDPVDEDIDFVHPQNLSPERAADYVPDSEPGSPMFEGLQPGEVTSYIGESPLLSPALDELDGNISTFSLSPQSIPAGEFVGDDSGPPDDLLEVPHELQNLSRSTSPFASEQQSVHSPSNDHREMDHEYLGVDELATTIHLQPEPTPVVAVVVAHHLDLSREPTPQVMEVSESTPRPSIVEDEQLVVEELPTEPLKEAEGEPCEKEIDPQSMEHGETAHMDTIPLEFDAPPQLEETFSPQSISVVEESGERLEGVRGEDEESNSQKEEEDVDQLYADEIEEQMDHTYPIQHVEETQHDYPFVQPASHDAHMMEAEEAQAEGGPDAEPAALGESQSTVPEMVDVMSHAHLFEDTELPEQPIQPAAVDAMEVEHPLPATVEHDIDLLPLEDTPVYPTSFMGASALYPSLTHTAKEEPFQDEIAVEPAPDYEMDVDEEHYHPKLTSPLMQSAELEAEIVEPEAEMEGSPEAGEEAPMQASEPVITEADDMGVEDSIEKAGEIEIIGPSETEENVSVPEEIPDTTPAEYLNIEEDTVSPILRTSGDIEPLGEDDILGYPDEEVDDFEEVVQTTEPAIVETSQDNNSPIQGQKREESSGLVDSEEQAMSDANIPLKEPEALVAEQTLHPGDQELPEAASESSIVSQVYPTPSDSESGLLDTQPTELQQNQAVKPVEEAIDEGFSGTISGDIDPDEGSLLQVPSTAASQDSIPPTSPEGDNEITQKQVEVGEGEDADGDGEVDEEFLLQSRGSEPGDEIAYSPDIQSHMESLPIDIGADPAQSVSPTEEEVEAPVEYVEEEETMDGVYGEREEDVEPVYEEGGAMDPIHEDEAVETVHEEEEEEEAQKPVDDEEEAAEAEPTAELVLQGAPSPTESGENLLELEEPMEQEPFLMEEKQVMIDEHLEPHLLADDGPHVNGRTERVVPSSETPSQATASPLIQDMDISEKQEVDPFSLVGNDNTAAPGVVPMSSDEDDVTIPAVIVDAAPDTLDQPVTNASSTEDEVLPSRDEAIKSELSHPQTPQTKPSMSLGTAVVPYSSFITSSPLTGLSESPSMSRSNGDHPRMTDDPLDTPRRRTETVQSETSSAAATPTASPKHVPVLPPVNSATELEYLIPSSTKGKEKAREEEPGRPNLSLDLNGRLDGVRSQGTPTPPRSPSLTIKIPSLANRRHHHHHHKKASSLSNIYSRKPVASTSNHALRPANSSAPMTRSHCRFHKVSIPIPSDSEDEDEDPVPKDEREHTNFIIPACALSVPELMRVEGMVDCGPATEEENDEKILDLSDVNSDLIGLVRQLVGNDILREQDVGLLMDEYAKHAFVHSKGSAKRRGKGALESRSQPNSSPTALYRAENGLRQYRSNPSPLKRHFTAHAGPSYKEATSGEEDVEMHSRPPPSKKARTSGSGSSTPTPQQFQGPPPLLSVGSSPAVVDQTSTTGFFVLPGSQAEIEQQNPPKPRKGKRKMADSNQAYRPSPDAGSRGGSTEAESQPSQGKKRKRGRPKKTVAIAPSPTVNAIPGPSSFAGSPIAASAREGSISTTLSRSHSHAGSMSTGGPSPKPQRKRLKKAQMKPTEDNIVVMNMNFTP